ncbi:MAG: glycosyltransferase family 2 protein, partial [Phormidesmis sp.]
MPAPIVFIIFNRPDTTRRVLDRLRALKPAKLFVIADGPRRDRPLEAEKCAKTRAVIDSIDWDCEVLKNYSDTNLGCKNRVVSGLNWVFEQVNEAIIIEDDCLPHLDFFTFCDELLAHYRNDERIMSIGGTNRFGKWKDDKQSYHFSYHGSIWGWATWKRAWQHYDPALRLWQDSEIKQRTRDVLADPMQYRFREKVFDMAYAEQTHGWSYAWRFAMLIQSGLSILPSVNLVSNIGFGEAATSTTSNHRGTANLPTFAA